MARLSSRGQHDPVARYRCEQRLLVCVTAATIIAVFLWVVAVATDHWFHVQVPGGVYINKTGLFFISSYSGLWRICKQEILNGTQPGIDPTTTCQYHVLFPSDAEIKADPETDHTILDYTRTEVAFSIISVCLMFMGVGFSIYTFKEPRYMFKRLAGGIHFFAAATVLVVIEVVTNSVKYEEQYLTARHPREAVWSYGFSIILAWITFTLYITAGCVFIICSHKRKGDKAASELQAREDEPQIIGRM